MICPYSLVYCDVRIGLGIANNVGSKGQMGVEFSKRCIQCLSIFNVEFLSSLLPLVNVRRHIVRLKLNLCREYNAEKKTAGRAVFLKAQP